MPTDIYDDREQTQAKHFILRRYLQALAFKVLRGWDITYVDGFSGPWQSRTEDFADTSFMIAIEVLKDAQKRIQADSGRLRHIRCYFSEKDRTSYGQLKKAVEPFNNPAERFEIHTYHGTFEDAVPEIVKVIGNSFPLIFIDPTGWTGYPFPKIKPLFDFPKCEVLINFMYDFVNRFVASADESTIASLDPILGGPGWLDRIDSSLPRGPAVEKLFRETLKSTGKFDHVISTKIDKPTVDRPHFFLAYGTKSREGLKAFRQTEYDALKAHAKNRESAKDRRNVARTGMSDMFASFSAEVQEASIDELVAEEKSSATKFVSSLLKETASIRFADLVDIVLEAFMLREKNVKDICVQLARDGVIEKTWDGGNRKPSDQTIIRRV